MVERVGIAQGRTREGVLSRRGPATPQPGSWLLAGLPCDCVAAVVLNELFDRELLAIRMDIQAAMSW